MSFEKSVDFVSVAVILIDVGKVSEVGKEVIVEERGRIIRLVVVDRRLMLDWRLLRRKVAQLLRRRRVVRLLRLVRLRSWRRWRIILLVVVVGVRLVIVSVAEHTSAQHVEIARSQQTVIIDEFYLTGILLSVIIRPVFV